MYKFVHFYIPFLYIYILSFTEDVFMAKTNEIKVALEDELLRKLKQGDFYKFKMYMYMR